MTAITLRSKFDLYIVNKAVDGPKKALLTLLNRLFQTVRSNKDLDRAGFTYKDKAYIFEHKELPGWIIKARRSGMYKNDTIADTHVYRVRKALRVENYLKERGIKGFIIPQKLLFEHNGEWYVLAQKFDFDIGKEAKELQRCLTLSELKTLFEVVRDCRLADIYPENIGITGAGEKVLFDLEPLNRKTNKAKKLWLTLPIYANCHHYTNTIQETDILYGFATNDEAKHLLRTEQRKVTLYFLAKQIAWIALPILAFLTTFSIGHYAPLALAGTYTATTLYLITVSMFNVMKRHAYQHLPLI